MKEALAFDGELGVGVARPGREPGRSSLIACDRGPDQVGQDTPGGAGALLGRRACPPTRRVPVRVSPSRATATTAVVLAMTWYRVPYCLRVM